MTHVLRFGPLFIIKFYENSKFHDKFKHFHICALFTVVTGAEFECACCFLSVVWSAVVLL